MTEAEVDGRVEPLHIHKMRIHGEDYPVLARRNDQPPVYWEDGQEFIPLSAVSELLDAMKRIAAGTWNADRPALDPDQTVHEFARAVAARFHTEGETNERSD